MKRANPKHNLEEDLKARVDSFGGESGLDWIYRNDIEEVWNTYIVNEKM